MHGTVLATCAQVHFVYVVALRCYKLLQKEVTQSAHKSKSLLIYVQALNAVTDRDNKMQTKQDTAQALPIYKVVELEVIEITITEVK